MLGGCLLTEVKKEGGKMGRKRMETQGGRRMKTEGRNKKKGGKSQENRERNGMD